MSEELSGLTRAIREAHAVADEVTEQIESEGERIGQWRVGLTETEPEVLYEAEDEESPSNLIVRDVSDGATARYVFRELVDRGCDVDTGLPNEEEQPTIVYLYRADSTD